MNDLAKLTLLALLLLGGCGQGSQDEDGSTLSRGSSEVGGSVVSTVNGHPITLWEVEAASRLGGVPPRTALARLQEELLLALEAERAGFNDADADARATRQAAVQLLLRREIEERVPESRVADMPISEGELAAGAESLRSPERRGSVQLMAVAPADAPPAQARAAERWIAEQWQLVATAANPEEAIMGMNRRTFAELPFAVVAEDVPPLTADDDSAPAYTAELFRTPAVGLPSEPFLMQDGWHILVLTELQEAREPTDDEVREHLRQQRLAVLRAEAVGELVSGAMGRAPVELDRQGVNLVLHEPALIGAQR